MQKLYYMLHLITQFAEVGEESLPIKEIIETGLASGSEYFFVEHDEVIEVAAMVERNLSN